MIVYANASYRSKKKRKPKGVVARKINKSLLAGTGLPNLNYASRGYGQIQSLKTSACYTTKNSVMDPMQLAKETPEVQEAIIAKSKRIAPAYNKGAAQFITDEADLTCLGRKI